jgi:hypothetical protein
MVPKGSPHRKVMDHPAGHPGSLQRSTGGTRVTAGRPPPTARRVAVPRLPEDVDEAVHRGRQALPLPVDDRDRADQPPIPSGTAPSIRMPTSFATAGRGRMLTPAAMAIACLIVSMLSNCMTTSTRTPAWRRTRSMARRIGRSWSKATNRSPWRSRLGQAAARQPMGRVADQHHRLLAERQDLERPVRRRVRQDPEVGLVAQDRPRPPCEGAGTPSRHAGIRIHRHERLHVAAHVVEPDRVDRGHADGALHALPRGGELHTGPVEIREERPAGLVEAPPLRGRLERPARSVQELDVEIRSRAAGSPGSRPTA